MGFFDGLFPSSTKTSVSTSVSRIVSDAALPNSIKNGVTQALFKQGNISEYVLEEYVGSIGRRAEKMYAYAEKSYTYGMPSGELYLSTQSQDAVVEVIKRMNDETIQMEYSFYGPINFLHCGWVKLIELYQYDSSTNQLTILSTAKQTPVYLKDMTLVVPSDAATRYSSNVIAQYGVAPCAGYTPERPAMLGVLNSKVLHTPIQLNDTVTDVQVLLTYCWKVGLDLFQETIPIDISGFNREKDYFQAKYYYQGKANLFMYEDGSGLYPTLDAAHDAPTQVMGDFFPNVYFRLNKQFMDTDKSGDNYKTSKKLASYLGMDYLDVISQINKNPDVSKVEQAFVMMAVPANDSSEVGAKYLFDFFNKLYYFLPVQYESFVQGTVTEWGTTPGYYVPIAQPPASASAFEIKDTVFKTVLSNQAIVKKRKIGSIAAIGKYKTSFESRTETIRAGSISLSQDNGLGNYEYNVVSEHIYQYQVTDNTYEEIRVKNLSMTYFIWNGYNTVGDGTNPILLVPLDRSITKDYPLKDKEDLYAMSLHFVFNAVQQTEVQWYQSDLFQFFIMAVSLYIVVTTGIDTYSAYAAMIANGVAIETVILLAITDLIALAITQEAFKLFVKAVGGDVATALAIAAALYGGYKVYQAGSIKGAPWASDLLRISSNLFQGVQLNLQDKYNALRNEAESFGAYAKEQEDKLDKANDLLKNDNTLSPFIFFGETPDEFFRRTVHSGNIGIVGIDAIGSFVETSLALPRINETLESNYG